MTKREFRFRPIFISLNGIYNIPIYIIDSDFGYGHKTYCCKNCGELYVVETEAILPSHLHSAISTLDCQKCQESLKDTIVEYPKNIFYNGRLFNNDNLVMESGFEKEQVLEVYVID